MSGLNKRFPQSMKKLREKFPKGLLIQVRFIGDDGGIIEFEGRDGAVFEDLVAVMRSDSRLQDERSLARQETS